MWMFKNEVHNADVLDNHDIRKTAKLSNKHSWEFWSGGLLKDLARPGSHSLVSLPRNYFSMHCLAESTDEDAFLNVYKSIS